MRINKLLSNYGYCSRTEANRLIEENRVYVNGELCIPGQWVEKEDFITLDGKEVKEKEKIYLAFYKPRGIICTAAKDKENNIIDFINYGEYIFPVGRLDKDSEGLILLTNDGELALHKQHLIPRLKISVKELLGIVFVVTCCWTSM